MLLGDFFRQALIEGFVRNQRTRSSGRFFFTGAALVLIQFNVAGCAKTLSFERVGDLVVEVSPPGGGELVALEDQPLTINVDVPGDNDAWVRARYFFQNYTSGEPIVLDRELSSDPSSEDIHKCQVFRKPTRQGAQYVVGCSGADAAHSRAAAQNIARFLQSGVLTDTKFFSFR